MFDSNFITSIGVFLILVAYFFNVTGKLDKNVLYFSLNIVGSLLAGVGAYMVNLWPIVFLEVVWAIISLVAIFNLKNKIIR